jgi:hypothetical protein
MQTPSNREEALARAQAGELLGPMDVAALVGKGPSRFNALNQQGKYDFLKVKPAIGPRCFSGAKVYRYVQGELEVEEPIFGRKARRVS